MKFRAQRFQGFHANAELLHRSVTAVQIFAEVSGTRFSKTCAFEILFSQIFVQIPKNFQLLRKQVLIKCYRSKFGDVQLHFHKPHFSVGLR